MTMNITNRQMEITPVVRQCVADCLAKLEKWQTHLINPYIILSEEPQGFVVDATINTPNGVLATSGKYEDMYTAISELINKLERQPNKLRHKGEVRRAAASVKNANFVEEAEEEQSLILSAPPARLRVRSLLTARKQYGYCIKVT